MEHRKDQSLRVTFRPAGEPELIRVVESVERFQFNGHKVEVSSILRGDLENVVIVHGPKKSLLELAKYIDALEKLAKDWTIPTIPD